METERRTKEGSGLRSFVDVQIARIGAFFTQWEDERNLKKAQLITERRLVETVVDGSDKRLRAVSGYVEALRGCACDLFNQVGVVAEGLPVATLLSRKSFSTNPLVNSLFATPEDIDELFSRDEQLSDFLMNQPLARSELIHAFLTATLTKKHVIGNALVRDEVVGDVVQLAINFSDLTIHCPSGQKTEVITGLKTFMFDRILADVRRDMDIHRHAEAERIHKGDMEGQIRSLNNPEVYLQALVKVLGSATRSLHLLKTPMKLNKFGMIVEEDSIPTHEFDLYEISWNPHSKDVVSLVECKVSD